MVTSAGAMTTSPEINRERIDRPASRSEWDNPDTPLSNSLPSGPDGVLPGRPAAPHVPPEQHHPETSEQLACTGVPPQAASWRRGAFSEGAGQRAPELDQPAEV
jgi:hypothetical protein